MWSSTWKRSVKPRKQRAYVHYAPYHVRSELLQSTLSKDLRAKHSKRSVRVRIDDTVKVMRGTFKKKTGKVTRVDVVRQRIYVEGVELLKKDGSKAAYPLNASNLMIMELAKGKRRFGKNKDGASSTPKESTKGTSAKSTSAKGASKEANTKENKETSKKAPAKKVTKKETKQETTEKSQ